jgi:hypothetical protein
MHQFSTITECPAGGGDGWGRDYGWWVVKEGTADSQMNKRRMRRATEANDNERLKLPKERPALQRRRNPTGRLYDARSTRDQEREGTLYFI